MTKKLMRSMIIISIILFIIGVMIMTVSFCSFGTKNYRQTLFAEAKYFGQGVLMSGTEYFDGLDLTDKHVVWLDAKGQVLYDSLGGASSGESYFERQEVTQALEDGEGSYNYGQDAFTGKTVSCAVKLSDGSVMLVSALSNTFLKVLSGIEGSIVTVLVIFIIATAITATLVSRSLIAKLNSLEPDGANDADMAAELKPMLDRLAGKAVPEAENKDSQS